MLESPRIEIVPGREMIASRETHEVALRGVLDRLKEKGYFREGDRIDLAFPDEGNLEDWMPTKGKWPEGMGKAVARCEVTSLIIPDAKPGPDTLHAELVALGYGVDVWPNFEKMSGTEDCVNYFLYERPKPSGEAVVA